MYNRFVLRFYSLGLTGSLESVHLTWVERYACLYVFYSMNRRCVKGYFSVWPHKCLSSNSAITHIQKRT